MVFRKSLTTLAAVALVAFAVTIAQAGSCGSPCPSKAQAGCASRPMMADASCGHVPMNAQGCAAMCRSAGMASGGDQGKMPADCCKGMMMGGRPHAMQGDMRGMDCGQMSKSQCMEMMKQGMCDMGSMGNEGCKWPCNGIWGDYDCSNPGGNSLLDYRSHRGRHMMIMCGRGGDEGCKMMMGKMGCGDRGMKMMRMEGGCCTGGPKMERKVIMMHKHDGACKPGCMGMGMQHGAAGTPPPPPPPPPPAPAPEGVAPPPGK